MMLVYGNENFENENEIYICSSNGACLYVACLESLDFVNFASAALCSIQRRTEILKTHYFILY